jgi:TPR repeat protein
VRTWNFLSGAFSFGALVAASFFATQTAHETIASTFTSAAKDRVQQTSPARFVQAAPEEFSISDVAGEAGQTIALNIKPNPAEPPEDLFTITGLPPEVKLSSGAPYEDFWLVRREELSSLTITTPDGFSRKFQIAVTRVRAADRPPVTLTATVSVSNKPSGADILNGLPAVRGRSPYVRTQSENALFEKARERFKKGDVAGARAIFEVLATKGDPDAAIAMGETYDPVVLAQLFIKGLQPDEAKAVSWYRKAEELGDQRARTRLNALNQN